MGYQGCTLKRGKIVASLDCWLCKLWSHLHIFYSFICFTFSGKCRMRALKWKVDYLTAMTGDLIISSIDSLHLELFREDHSCVLKDSRQIGVTCVQWRQVLCRNLRAANEDISCVYANFMLITSVPFQASLLCNAGCWHGNWSVTMECWPQRDAIQVTIMWSYDNG